MSVKAVTAITRLQLLSWHSSRWYLSGGTYISQFKAASAHAAAAKHAAHLISIKGIRTPSDRKRLADRLSTEQPIAIQGIRNVWCCSASVGMKFALVNIVATA